jgi:hypothetical protein
MGVLDPRPAAADPSRVYSLDMPTGDPGAHREAGQDSSCPER